jgi:hypothetical protein
MRWLIERRRSGARPANTSIESADASSLRRFAPAISMMKAAEPGTGDCLSQPRSFDTVLIQFRAKKAT